MNYKYTGKRKCLMFIRIRFFFFFYFNSQTYIHVNLTSENKKNYKNNLRKINV